jgi:hypothetical protein
MLTEQPWNHFKRRHVRDLAWALYHPALFQATPHLPPEYLLPIWQDDGVFSWLTQVDAHPETLIQHLKNQRATRLGVYFEQLLSFFFTYYPRFTLLAKNLQANDSKRTIGEYDFIIFDQYDQQHYHIEVAVKFYLGLSNLNESIPNNVPIHNWHLWIGPNKKDTLGIKMRHLMNHQLRLSETTAGQKALSSIHLTAEQLKPKLLLTGRLYYPKPTTCTHDPKGEMDTHAVRPPKYSTIGHCQHTLSQWLKPSQIEDMCCSDACYVILPRSLWMAEIHTHDCRTFNLPLLSKAQLYDHIHTEIAHHAQPIHVAAIHPNKPEIAQEQRRFFVIPH